MGTPYASVILPTLNRHSTLPYALASVQAQTVADLEVIIALDGATSSCRDIALTAARADSRVVVLDLPKSVPGSHEHVHLAVTQARGERVFYTDDDDLWLADHVETLGPCLEKADIVDSRVCSVDRSGGLNLGPCRGSNRLIKDHLRHHRLKLLYDTHIAHRRDAYGRFARWRSAGDASGGVWEFFATFAAHQDCRWASCEAVTALSLHGAARRDLGAADRQIEIGRWSAQLHDVRPRLAQAGSLFHLFRLLSADPPEAGGFEDYLSTRGGYADVVQGRWERDLFVLFEAAHPPSEPTAVILAELLSEPVEAGYEMQGIALVMFRAYGQEGAERILAEAAARAGPNAAARLAAYSAVVARRDIGLSVEIAREAVIMGPDPIGGLQTWCDGLSAILAGHS